MEVEVFKCPKRFSLAHAKSLMLITYRIFEFHLLINKFIWRIALLNNILSENKL